MGFPRQEYWSGLPFPSPGDLPDPRVKLASPAWQVDSSPLSHLGSRKGKVLWVELKACDGESPREPWQAQCQVRQSQRQSWTSTTSSSGGPMPQGSSSLLPSALICPEDALPGQTTGSPQAHTLAGLNNFSAAPEGGC